MNKENNQKTGGLDPAISKFRLGVFTQDPANPISHGRVFGPLGFMSRQDPRLELVLPSQKMTKEGLAWSANWDWMLRCDAIFLENPFDDTMAHVVALAGMTGTPVWSDFADDLSCVRTSNPAWEAFADLDTLKDNIKFILEHSAVATCPTETARLRFPCPERMISIPVHAIWPQYNLPRKKVVTWRGLSSHTEDVESVLPEIIRVAADPQFADWTWALFGDPPMKMREGLQNVLCPSLDPTERNKRIACGDGKRLLIAPYLATPYHQMLAWASLCPYLHLVPLPDNDFNQTKPPLAWMEAAAVGAATIGPDMPEWSQCDGLIRYKDASDFEAKLRRHMEEYSAFGETQVTGGFHPGVQISRDAIYPALTEPEVHKVRWAILNKLWKQRVVGPVAPVGQCAPPAGREEPASGKVPVPTLDEVVK